MSLSRFLLFDRFRRVLHYFPCRTMVTLPYGFVVRARLFFYTHGWLQARRLPCPVISVGNLTVGGTGKTPMVIWLAAWLQAQGKRVGILSRGYGRIQSRDIRLVSNGQCTLLAPKEGGDEPVLMANRCPGVVVAVGVDRYRVGKWVGKQFPIDCFLLDDGFQHLGLYREANFLLIDATDLDGLRHLLPVGRLREPLCAAVRATAIVLTRTSPAEDYRSVLEPVEQAIGHAIQPILVNFYVASFIHVPTGKVQSCKWAKGRRGLIVSGIGHADHFRAMVSNLHVEILDELVFPDHYSYTASHWSGIRDQAARLGAPMIVTTEKDAVKIRPFLTVNDEVWAVRLDVRLESGMDQLESQLFDIIQERTVSQKVT